MILDIPFIAALILLRQKRQQLIDYNFRRKNNRQRVGKQVYKLVKVKNPITAKLHTRTHGPYQILQVHTKGTLTIQRNPHLIDRVNIHYLRPAFV